MSIQPKKFERRGFLRGALATAVLVPAGGALASCAGGGGGGSNKAATGAVSDSNPFGMGDKTKIDAVVFNGGYKTDYVDFAGDILKKNHSGTDVKVSASTDISGELQPRFVGGNPPDMFDNSGAKSIAFSTIVDQLEPLDSVFAAKNLEGQVISDTVYPGVKDPGTFGDKFLAMNYVLTVYALWYSGSLFEENGWTPPKTWDEAIDLGSKAAAKGKKLFVFGTEAATYYHELAVSSAIKEGGDEVRLALENLDANAWSQPAITGVLGKLEEIIKRGYFVPGGSGTKFTQAQAQWSNDEMALLYPSGSWIENEMKDQTKAGFKMTGVPVPTLTSSPKLPYTALHSEAGEPFAIPSKAANIAGAKELMRTMLSKEASQNFTKTRLAPTIIKGLLPDDGYGSTALQAQKKMLDQVGTNVFTYKYETYYGGMHKTFLTLWNSFLDGKMSAADLAKNSQSEFDKIRNDSSIKKLQVK